MRTVEQRRARLLEPPANIPTYRRQFAIWVATRAPAETRLTVRAALIGYVPSHICGEHDAGTTRMRKWLREVSPNHPGIRHVFDLYRDDFDRDCLHYHRWKGADPEDDDPSCTRCGRSLRSVGVSTRPCAGWARAQAGRV